MKCFIPCDAHGVLRALTLLPKAQPLSNPTPLTTPDTREPVFTRRHGERGVETEHKTGKGRVARLPTICFALRILRPPEQPKSSFQSLKQKRQEPGLRERAAPGRRMHRQAQLLRREVDLTGSSSPVLPESSAVFSFSAILD